MRILSTIVWLHHLKSNEMLEDKGGLEINMGTASCMEQIQKTT